MKDLLKRLLGSPVFITVTAFSVRMALFYIQWKGAPTPVRANLPYGYELGRVARAIAAGEGFSSPLRGVDSGPTIWFTPIYPYLIAGIFKIWGIYSDMSRIVIEIMNCALAALTIIPIHGIAKNTFGERAAICAAWIWVFSPIDVSLPVNWIWDTALIGLIFGLIFWATLALREKHGLLPWAGYGALWVMGILINPSILSLFPFFLGWLVWEARKEAAPWGKPAATALLVFMIGLVPWTIRNYRVFGKFVVLRSNFGLELWLGNNPEVTDTVSQFAHPNDNPKEADKYVRLGEIAYMAEKQHEALTFMRSHRGDTIYFMFHRFVNTWLSVTDSPFDTWVSSSLGGKAFLVFNSSLSLLSLLGVLFLSRARHPEAYPYGFVLLIFPLIFYLTHSNPRYRYPIDAIILVLASGGLAHLISVLRFRISPENSAATPVPSRPAN
jgi:4-amino-4-deoxy-L-arabinose transferase-like glycosyltransferase